MLRFELPTERPGAEVFRGVSRVFTHKGEWLQGPFPIGGRGLNCYTVGVYSLLDDLNSAFVEVRKKLRGGPKPEAIPAPDFVPEVNVRPNGWNAGEVDLVKKAVVATWRAVGDEEPCAYDVYGFHNILVGAGSGSSSALVQAAIRATAAEHINELADEKLSAIHAEVEYGADPLNLTEPAIVATRLKLGRPLKVLGHRHPDFLAVTWSAGKPRQTASVEFGYEDEEFLLWRVRWASLEKAIRAGDDLRIARLATESARENQKHNENADFELLEAALHPPFGALGISVAHTGSYHTALFATDVEKGVKDAFIKYVSDNSESKNRILKFSGPQTQQNDEHLEMIHSSLLEALCLPRLFYPFPNEAPNLIGVAFEFMKRIPAQFCIEQALEPIGRQKLGPIGLYIPATTNSNVGASTTENERRKIFIETSSGNMATGLAEICQLKGLPLLLLLPSEVDEPTRKGLVDLGAIVEDIDTSDQNTRIEKLKEIEGKYQNDGWDVVRVSQYTNPNNQIAYWRLAEYLVSEFDSIDCLVAPVGTGGSSCGTARHLRRSGFPHMELVGVDACGSVNFEHSPSDFLMGGLGSTRPMPLVDQDAFDIVHWLDDNTAFATAIDLFQVGIPVGGSSGAAMAAARYEARIAPEKSVIVICPDNARRYAGTFFSEKWRQENNVDLNSAQKEPTAVKTPKQSDPSTPGVKPAWYRIDWREHRAQMREVASKNENRSGSC